MIMSRFNPIASCRNLAPSIVPSQVLAHMFLLFQKEPVFDLKAEGCRGGGQKVFFFRGEKAPSPK